MKLTTKMPTKVFTVLGGKCPFGRGCEHRFAGNTKPTDQTLKDSGIIVRGLFTHYCDERCAADANHDAAVKRAGNLKQFAPGQKFERK